MADFSIDRMHPRAKVQQYLIDGELTTLLEMAGMLHGHYCPGLALGVKAVQVAFKHLGMIDNNTGMEEIMAVVECNNCFVDGIQFIAGCTLGNNALVYKDFGKTAVTVYRRGATEAVRIVARSFDVNGESEEEKKEGDALFEKAVKRREKLTENESVRMKELWTKRSFSTIDMPGEALFTISDVNVPPVPFAPILDSQECSRCTEKVMESKAVFRNGKPLCISCAGEEYRMIIGKGIAVAKEEGV